MQDRRKTKDQLLIELAALRQRIAELDPPSSPPVLPPPAPFDVGAFNHTLMNALPEAITLSDLSGTIVFANLQAARLHGYERPAALLGLNVFELIAAPDRERAAGLVRAALAGGTTVELEIELRRRDGQAFAAQLTVTALRDAQGLPQAVIGVTRDITAQKQAEAALQVSEAQLRAVVDAQTELICRYQPDGTLTFVNDVYCRTFGRTREELIGQSYLPLIPPEDHAYVASQLAKFSPDNPVLTIEHRVILPDGKVHWQQWTDRALYDAQGRLLGFQSVGRDVTKRKRIEQELADTRTALEVAISQSPIPMALLSAPEGVIQFVNPAMRELLGRQAEPNEVGLRLAEVERTWTILDKHDNPLPPFQSPDLTAVQGARQINNLPTKIRRRDGTTRSALTSAIPVYDAQGRQIAAFVVAVDVTEREELESALRASEQRLNMALAAARAGVWEYDLPAKRAVWSDSNYRLMGYEPGSVAVSVENWLAAVHPDDRVAAYSTLLRAIEQQRDLDMEFRVVWPDLSVHWLRVAGSVTCDQQGQLQKLIGLQLDITESKRLVEALAASQEHYRLLAQNLPDTAVYLFDRELRYTLVEGDILPLLGFARDQMLGRTLRDVLPRERAERLAPLYQAALGGITQTDLTLDYQGRYFNVSIVPVRNAHGEVVAGMVMSQDITARKQAEEALQRLNFELEQRVIERTMELETLNNALQDDIRQRQRIEDMLRRSEQRYRTLFESAGDAIFIVDLTGHVIEANRMAAQQLGYTREELLGMPVRQFDGSPEAMSVEDRVDQLRRQGEHTFDAVHVRRDGSRLPVEIRSAVVEYGGSPAILGVVRDVTDRKHAEQTLRRYADEQAALYNTALFLNAQLDVAVVLHRIAGQATRLLGVQAGGVYVYDQARDALVMAVALGFYTEYLGATLKPGEGLSGQAFQQRQLLRLDDYQTWEEQASAFRHDSRIHAVITAPLLGKHAPLGVLFVVSDQYKQRFDDHDAQLVELLTAQAAIALENAQLYEQQQAQYRRLQDAQTRLVQSEKMSALGRLIASISHEINNPLQAVQGCLALVREGIDEAPALDALLAADWQQDLAVAAGEVQRIAGIVQRLRDFYRPARPGWHAVEVLGALDSVLALTAKQLQHSRIMVEQVRSAPPPLSITSNADQLKQIVLNLVLNAIDAMPNGGRLRVTTSLDDEHTPAQVRIDFADNGQGISPENLASIFEPFFTTKDTGSGLGLAISYELIKALGGDIAVSSEVGQGSTFTLRLPVDGAPDNTGAPSNTGAPNYEEAA